MLAKTKILGLALATAMAFTSPVLVWADNGPATDISHHEGDWHQGHHDQMMAKILGLSDDQVKQLKDSREKQKTAMKGIFEQMKSNREAFSAEITKATPDMGKVNDLQTQLKTIQAQMADNYLNSLLEIKKIMTPEQFAGYMALEKAKKMMMHKGHGKFGPHGHWGDKSDKDHDADGQD